MFIKLKAPVFVAFSQFEVPAIETDVYLNVDRIGCAVFKALGREMLDPRDKNRMGKLPASTVCLEVHPKGDVAMIPHSGDDRYLILFPDEQRSEFQRLKRILEDLVIDK